MVRMMSKSKQKERTKESGDTESPINICPKCGADLFKVGVTEATAGGYSETEIRFENGEALKGFTDVQNFDEQWTICGNCGARLSDRTASDVIRAYEKGIRIKERM